MLNSSEISSEYNSGNHNIGAFTVEVNEVPIILDNTLYYVAACNINNNNYFKLRDLDSVDMRLTN